MLMMKNIKLNFENREKLESIIKDVYFCDDNNGRLLENFKQRLDISSNIKELLDDMDDYMIKLKSPIIDGTISCEIVREEGDLFLKPISKYCIVNEHTDRYTFY